jgi:hypothetical protein
MIITIADSEQDGRWWSGWVGNGKVHVVPIDDLEPHHATDCSCHPVVTMHVDTDGFMSWMVTHNSYDNRETDECG